MRLDMLKVACVLERGDRPVQPAEPAMERGIAVTDRAKVAFEVSHVYRVEADLRTHKGVSKWIYAR